MKQRRLIVIPILALTFLVSCSSESKFSLKSQTTYTVTFDSKGGSYTPDAQTIIAYEQVSKPDVDPSKDDCVFKGWYTDEDATKYKYDFSRPVVSDLTLYARWEDAHKFVSVTFDARDGLFGGTSRYLGLSVPIGTKVRSVIKMIKDFEPISDNKIFACYSYKGNDNVVIDYEDTIDGDITLKANYLDGSKPYTNLDEITWDFIKQVAVTKNDISKAFALGATKKVDLYGQDHEVRIIGFNEDYKTITKGADDKWVKSDPVGITFEFANLITNEDGTSLKTFWNEEPQNKSSANNKFIGSTFYTLLNGVGGSMEECIFSDLPPELKDVTQLVTKTVGQGGDTVEEAEISITYKTRLFPLGRAEIEGGGWVYGMPRDEGTLYKYYSVYATNKDRIKAPVKGDQNIGENYWLRSPYCTKWDYYPEAWYIPKNSGVPADRAVCETTQTHEGIGLAPAFCI